MDKVAYLTFDDGPSANTLKILEILDLYQVKATFFVVGFNCELETNICQQIVQRGHVIGNHTYSHDTRKIYASLEAFKQDVAALDDLLQNKLQIKSDIFRFPGGSNSSSIINFGSSQWRTELIKEVHASGYGYIDWNVDSRDASAFLVDMEIIITSVLYGAWHKEKIVVLMHDTPVKTTTVRALPEILLGLKTLGFRFETLTKASFPYG